MIQIKGGIKWLPSTGGPFILMETSNLPYWKGVFGTTYDAHPDAITDYQRACEINDYVGVINVGNGNALVLGEEPFETAWLNTYYGDGIIVRWVWADDDEQIITALRKLPLNQMWEVTGVEITFPTGSLILIDSSNGDEFLNDSLNIEIQPGKYAINSSFLKPNNRVNLLLHRMVRIL